VDYEGRRFRVVDMAGHRINRVIVEDIATRSSPSANMETTQ